MSRLPDGGDRVRQVDAAGDPRPRGRPLAVLRARAFAAGDQPAHAVAAAARARGGGRRRTPDLPRGAAARRVRADRQGPGSGAADRGHADLRDGVARRRLRGRSPATATSRPRPRRCRASASPSPPDSAARRRSPRSRTAVREGFRRLGGETTRVRNVVLHRLLETYTVDVSSRLVAAMAAGAELPYELGAEPPRQRRPGLLQLPAADRGVHRLQPRAAGPALQPRARRPRRCRSARRSTSTWPSAARCGCRPAVARWPRRR